MKYIFLFAVVLGLQLSLSFAENVSSGGGKQSYPYSPAPGAMIANTVKANMCTNGVTMVSGVSKDNPSNNPPKPTCEMNLNPDFAKLLETELPRCATLASQEVFKMIPTVPVAVHQIGGYANRPTNTPSGPGSSMSRHSQGMALDISGMTVFINGKPQHIEFTSNSNNQPFYDKFRTCWDNALRCSGKCTCSIGHPHTHPPSNEKHNDHMHISLTCPSMPGVAGC